MKTASPVTWRNRKYFRATVSCTKYFEKIGNWNWKKYSNGTDENLAFTALMCTTFVDGSTVTMLLEQHNAQYTPPTPSADATQLSS